MTIEEPKDLGEVETGEALFDLRDEILALVEAAKEDFKDRDGWMTERSRIALHAFNSALASL